MATLSDHLRGELSIQAIRAFGLATTTLRWDLTSVLVTGTYPPEEQDPGYAQVRYLQVPTDDGAVPIWEQVHDGNTNDVTTAIATMEALREQAHCQDFLLVGDSKLLSDGNRRGLLAAKLGYLAPLARTPELDAAFLAIPAADWVPLTYLSAHERRKPPEERGQYWGCERTISLTVTCTLVPAAVARAEALDGYYVLETTRSPAEADASALLTEWKGQWQVEHRHRAAKGPLRVRPLVVTRNRCIVGLLLILGIALLIFSLMERAARRALAAGEKVPGLLAGHLAARPTGDNLLTALSEITLVRV